MDTGNYIGFNNGVYRAGFATTREAWAKVPDLPTSTLRVGGDGKPHHRDHDGSPAIAAAVAGARRAEGQRRAETLAASHAVDSALG